MLFWLAKAWVLTSKNFENFENFVQHDENKDESKWYLTDLGYRFSVKNSGEWCQRQIAFFQVEASQFSLRKFQRAIHNTEVEYVTNGPPGELLTRK